MAATEVINFRVDAQDKQFFTSAAAAASTNLSDFLKDAATQKAMDVFYNRTDFNALTAENWDKIQAILDAPGDENKAFQAMMARTAPWE